MSAKPLNTRLNQAAKAKKDEFYTQLADIEKELKHYKDQFRGRVVYCNCDDPFESNFFKYFAANFNLKKADVIVTNPPFSLFREYVEQLMEYNKFFLILGNQNAITYKEIFKPIKENKLWLGYDNGDTK